MAEKKHVLTVGLTYTGAEIPGVHIETLGLVRPDVDKNRAAFALYEYDALIINPASYSHFIFGQEGAHSNDPHELGKLKAENQSYDIDTAFYQADRENEMQAAIDAGANVVWCFAPPRRQSFYGWRTTHMGYAARRVGDLVTKSELQLKRGRRIAEIDPDSPFSTYFESLPEWSYCLMDPAEGYTSIASTPEGYSLGGRVKLGTTLGWLVTPPTSEAATNQLVVSSIKMEKPDAAREKYHDIFLSHTGDDKPFVRQLRKDLLARGVPRVWLDEAEIQIGDSLIAKIEEGMKHSQFIGVVLSSKSVKAPWVKKELDVAMNREIAGGEVVVLPLLYEKCDLPEFLKGKLYADFTDPDDYEAGLAKLLRRLRI